MKILNRFASLRRARFARTTLSVLCALGLTALLSSTAGAITVVDDFSDADGTWPEILSSSGTSGQSEGPGLSGVIGGTRVSTYTYESTILPGDLTVEVDTVTLGGLFTTEADATVDSVIDLFYDGDGAGAGYSLPTGFGIAIESIGSDALIPITITLDDGVESASVVHSTNGDLFQSLIFKRPEFLADNPLIDLDDIFSININFDPGASGEFTIQLIENVSLIPEPSTLLLAGLGGLGLMLRRRRRRA
jgi:hypothetical protein